MEFHHHFQIWRQVPQKWEGDPKPKFQKWEGGGERSITPGGSYIVVC